MIEYRAGQDISAYRYILMGDISGIQDFIFNVKSEGAAKTLKSRSFFVFALAELCIELLDEAMSGNCLLFYNGGGNFYVFCKDISAIDLLPIRKTIQQELADTEIYITLSFTPLVENFGHSWRNLHAVANRDKLLQFAQFFPAFLEKNRPEPERWKEFAKELTDSQGFYTDNGPSRSRVDYSRISLFGKTLRLDKKHQNLQNSILAKLPEWTEKLLQTHHDYVERLHQNNLRKDPQSNKPHAGDIIEFETMGHFAAQRTGTDKIAVLKMDVDNLGALFLHTKDPAQTKTVSDALKGFFEANLLEIWGRDFVSMDKNGETRHPYKENIYIVFSGGDDCFIIGAWDAVFEFSKAVRDTFDAFLPSVGLSGLTLSASLTVLDSKFPVVRMNELAESALKAAKREDNQVKNRISVFGQIISWSEFFQAHTCAHTLEGLIKRKNLKRGVLNRFQLSHIGFEKLQEAAISKGKIANPPIWRLLYFIRRSEHFEDMQPIVETYQRALIEALTTQKRLNAAAMTPVAARWAEFLTRKKDKDNE
ncbi:MAG: hypothetical protein IAE84_03180 [Saprospiraceae bacterium]|nr:hypothetical protein [Saprospiraceae bacterium]